MLDKQYPDHIYAALERLACGGPLDGRKEPHPTAYILMALWGWQDADGPELPPIKQAWLTDCVAEGLADLVPSPWGGGQIYEINDRGSAALELRPSSGIKVTEPPAPPPQYVTRDQIAAIVGKSKDTIENWFNKEDEAPQPAIEGGGGKAHQYIWAEIRSWLEKKSCRNLPERYPTLPPR